MTIAIYIITNILTAKQYVGITNNLKRRWYVHSKAEGETYLYRAIRKYGLENFIFTHIADAFNSESAKQIEVMLIAEHNTFTPNGYNGTFGGDGTFGYTHSEESKTKSRESNKKAWSDVALRKSLGEKISFAKKGKPSIRKGLPSGRKGIKHTAEHAFNIKAALNKPATKKKHSDALKKAFSAPEWKAAQSATIKASWVIRKAMQQNKNEVYV